MARVRLLDPGFFTNEALVELPFEYRLLFAGLWTLADREGRLEDRPKRIRMALFPCDNVDCDAGLQALHDAGLVLRYSVEGVSYIAILAFAKFQKPHPRETQSVIPGPQGEPKANPRPAQGEPKDDEGIAKARGLSDSRTLGLSEKEQESASSDAPSSKGSRIPPDFPGPEEIEWCRRGFPLLDPGAVAEKFRDYWRGVPGQRGRKADWPATWRNFVRSERAPPRASPAAARDAETADFLGRLTGGLAGTKPNREVVDVEPANVRRIA